MQGITILPELDVEDIDEGEDGESRKGLKRNPSILQQQGVLVDVLFVIIFMANIILRIFNIRFIRLQNDTLFNYVISVHVNKSESMSPLTEFGNVDLMAWNGHILCAGETQYVTVAVFFTSMIRLSGVDIYLPSISMWESWSLPTIRLSESLVSAANHVTVSTPNPTSASVPVVAEPELTKDHNERLGSESKLMQVSKEEAGSEKKQWTAVEAYQSPGSGAEDDDNEVPQPSLATSPSKKQKGTAMKCQLTFTVEGNLKIVVTKSLLTKFYESHPVLNTLSLKETMRQELIRNGNSELMILQLKEDVLFGYNNNKSSPSKAAGSKQLSTESPNVATAILDDRRMKRDDFYNQIRLMTYYEPWDEIYQVTDAKQNLLCTEPHGGDVYQQLRNITSASIQQEGRSTTTSNVEDGIGPALVVASGTSNQRMTEVEVDPVSYALLFYFYMLILFKDIDDDIQNDSESYLQQGKSGGNAAKTSTANPLASPSDRSQRQRTLFGGTVSKSQRKMNTISYEEMQGIDIESLMKLYIIKNEGGLIKYITIRLMNAYNEYIILVLTLVAGNYSVHVMFLILVNVIVVGFANASRPAVSLHCGKKWYGSGNQWDDEHKCQVGNNYTNNLLSYFVSLCMSALTQLTLTNPKQDILELFVWSIAQVYLGLMSFSIVCIIGSVSNTKLGLAFPPPYNKHPVVIGICMFLAMCIPLLINVMIAFIPFATTCYVMGVLQIIFVMGLRFHREPHQFATAFFYSTISECCKLFLQIITYFLYVFHPERLQQIIQSLVHTYQHNMNDLLMAFMALVFFGVSILYAQIFV